MSGDGYVQRFDWGKVVRPQRHVNTAKGADAGISHPAPRQVEASQLHDTENGEGFAFAHYMWWCYGGETHHGWWCTGCRNQWRELQKPTL